MSRFIACCILATLTLSCTTNPPDTLAAIEAEADAEDRAIALATGNWAAPEPGLALYRGHRTNYWEGGSRKTTPGGRAYSKADPRAPIHDSHRPGGLATLAWHAFEIVPKSIARRAPGRPAWVRRGLWKWYLPLKEPRVIPHVPDNPAFHAVDASVWVRHAACPDYRPEALASRRPAEET